ncbi:cryptochrome/photolyase family protein [Phaeocystidibacter luteus]|uniref:Cryptochrome/photolyase family protein n=1 Tax=Phaeocystidibacter luteus TaxID=911197 RepID=A0A6N6RJ31_9FLAO|nr:cryptochrome/photolyase family protein [Phaeocystidibacter luteus]KAB2814302.1 cryptochrome/photolyase family protein [Phaeocystidibacter luteus]
MTKAKEVRFLLGDQLNIRHSWFGKSDEQVLYLLMEVRQETDYTTHHIQKVCGFFAAMREFAETLKSRGHRVHYLKLVDKNNQGDISANIKRIVDESGAKSFKYQEPDEFRLDAQLSELCNELSSSGIDCECSTTEHFYTERSFLKDFFKGKKTYLMENFYRHLRKEHDILLEAGKPRGGKWNYDKSNRKSLPKNHTPPAPLNFENDVASILEELEASDVKTIGSIRDSQLNWPISRTQSLQLLDYFVENALPWFGDYQDALTTESWAVYHSRLSFSMNVKLISPKEVVNRVLEQFEQHSDLIDISQVEGFVRQILGWREYMRGIYWAEMPEYASLNALDQDRKLPSWFWTGETKMKCLSHSITQSLEYAYAHHIQRLMVTGNFALLAGVHPDEVDDWYLGIYMDAIEWVEITNTRGMSQFADGGIVGTKPYVSSANYIDKMSDYCDQCVYDKKDKTGENACPFNSLYWHFYARNESTLSNNPRIGMMYRTWNKMSPEKRDELLKKGDSLLENIEEL